MRGGRSAHQCSSDSEQLNTVLKILLYIMEQKIDVFPDRFDLYVLVLAVLKGPGETAERSNQTDPRAYRNGKRRKAEELNPFSLEHN